MSEIIFSCECGMTLKVVDDGRSGGMADCPSCGASVHVPLSREAVIAPIGTDLDVDQAPEPESTGHENLAIIYITLVSLLTIGAIAFFLVPALRGSKDKAPDLVVASRPTVGDFGEKKEKESRHDRVPAERDADPIAADDIASAPLPRYIDPSPEPDPNATPAGPPGSPGFATAPDPVRKPPSPVANILPPTPRPAPSSTVRIPANRKPAPKPAPRPVNSPTQAALKLAEAKRLEDEGKKTAALAAYQAVVDEFPATLEHNLAKNRVNFLKKALAPTRPQSSPEHGGITPRG